jgi:hypothetical protein
VTIQQYNQNAQHEKETYFSRLSTDFTHLNRMKGEVIDLLGAPGITLGMFAGAIRYRAD